MTVLSEPALANKTYSRAKTFYQNQYVETYHPGTREKPGYVNSREERVERPCPKTLHFHGRKSHKHKEVITPTTIQLIHQQRQEDERLWRLPQQRTTFLFGRNPRWRRSRWSLGRRACQKAQLDLVDSCRGCWRCPVGCQVDGG